MRSRRSGVIVNVSSITGRLGIPFLAPYVASKHALEGLSEAMAYELRPFGVRVKLIEAGGVRTSFSHEWSVSPDYEPTSSKVRARMKAGAQKAAGPEGVAAVIYQAATDSAQRLRYPANGAGQLLRLRRLLPETVMRNLIARAF
jgi:short-subunit dehydrogenase